MEMFAVAGPKPQYEIAAYRRALFPERALDHLGNDILEALKERDSIYVRNWNRDRRFPGLAEEAHAMELDFGSGIEALLSPDTRPVLFLYGMIEYGYSSSNFALAQAGIQLRAPTFSVYRRGRWEALRKEWGFPGGTPRWMAVDLNGLLEKGDRRLRVETNLEIYWDQVFLAAALLDPDSAGLRPRTLAPDRAVLRPLGFPAGSRAEDRGTILYDYHDLSSLDEVLGKEMRRFPGNYTRFGDVLELLLKADDGFAVFGPGDEVALSYRSGRLPPLEPGWKRTYFLKAAGWCKDTDLYTAHPDRVEPLPFRAMAGYPAPAAAAETFESDPRRRQTAAIYNCRVVEMDQ
jgi:hypothetical protein